MLLRYQNATRKHIILKLVSDYKTATDKQRKLNILAAHKLKGVVRFSVI